MQTFAPYPDARKSASVLDYRRLGKQRVESLQILKCLLIPSDKKGWKNHPATKQWAGYENALVDYSLAMCEDWIKRGYKDTCFDKITAFWNKRKKTDYPEWWGREEFHSSHRQVLLSKDLEWYGQFGWTETPKYEYWWPTQHGF
jgi:hypothetical protein